MKRVLIKLIHGIKCGCILLLFYCLTPISILFLKRKKIWLISEIGFDARDNGFYFFKYLRVNHPEINAYYLISRKNRDFERVVSYKKVIKPFSFLHLLYFIASEVRASTICFGTSPSGYVTKYILSRKSYHGFDVCLKHGITKDFHKTYFSENCHLDMICCGARPEYEFFKKNFHYLNDEVQYTGFARFDELKNDVNKNKREILIMPTWRKWLPDSNDTIFLESNFYKMWAKLILDGNFNNLIRQENLDVVFFLHPRFYHYAKAFQINPSVKVKTIYDDSIHSHLCSASVMITDFSSVYFDFAYLNKPLIYYHFDKKQFRDGHYEKGYFDYNNDGFGDVCIDVSEVVNSLKGIIANNYSNFDKYSSRCHIFFELNDRNNCKRIYAAILNLCKR